MLAIPSMKSEKVHFSRVAEAEVRLVLGLIIISFLNVTIFNSLSGGQSSIFTILNRYEIYIYVLSIIGIILATLFRARSAIRNLFIILMSLLTANIVLNLLDLVVNRRISDNGAAIVADASLILFTSIGVFAIWYWFIDRGGPLSREIDDEDYKYDLLFPQYQTVIRGWEKWKPNFWDYYVFSFFTCTGFSPADTLPLSLKVKLLMMIEASISLIIIGMVISRALSLIQ